MAAASPGSCWTVTNPGPQPWNQPSLSLAYWVVVGLCPMGEEKGGYSPAGLWAPAAPPGLCPVARTDPDTYLLEELCEPLLTHLGKNQQGWFKWEVSDDMVLPDWASLGE